MSITKWFVSQNNTIQGPFTPHELQGKINDMGESAKGSFVWSRGQSDWTKADRWSPDVNYAENFVPQQQNTASAVNFAKPLSNLEVHPRSQMNEETNIGAPLKPEIDTTADTSISETLPKTEKFRVQLNFIEQSLMTREELLAFTARQDDVSKIAVFDNREKIWREIYTFADIVDKLGISRRQNQRVPILAQFNGKTSQHEALNTRLITISVGGMGLTDVRSLNVGDSVEGQISSPHFFAAIQVSAEVTYAGADGYVGLKFTQINDEGSALITDYIRRFGKDSESF